MCYVKCFLHRFMIWCLKDTDHWNSMWSLASSVHLQWLHRFKHVISFCTPCRHMTLDHHDIMECFIGVFRANRWFTLFLLLVLFYTVASVISVNVCNCFILFSGGILVQYVVCYYCVTFTVCTEISCWFYASGYPVDGAGDIMFTACLYVCSCVRRILHREAEKRNQFPFCVHLF